ncbi:MAG: hypothetical protein A3F90_20390 [Deltaproteobacteria bacterium RIFCSPLOWO2_12_FULL_60_19]|nr:MAG: hypothetical protein A3F90_20390 [Deltaproteobacteria bacterium RIFCSPLOWO2_12_FULL_60_19]
MLTEKSHAFTIIELLVAMGVAGTLMAIAIPQFMSWLPTINLSSGARRLGVDLHLARAKAISQNTMYRIAFPALPASSYTIEKFSGAAYAPESGPFNLPQGITVTAVTAAFNFEARGTVNTASTITLQNINGQTTTVSVNPVGRVKIP